MQIVIDIPEEQIKKSLEENKYIHEDEGEKGSVNIVMLYTNGQLNFVDVSRKTDFYSCEYKILPKNHGDLIDVSRRITVSTYDEQYEEWGEKTLTVLEALNKWSDEGVRLEDVIIPADKEEEE